MNETIEEPPMSALGAAVEEGARLARGATAPVVFDLECALVATRQPDRVVDEGRPDPVVRHRDGRRGIRHFRCGVAHEGIAKEPERRSGTVLGTEIHRIGGIAPEPSARIGKVGHATRGRRRSATRCRRRTPRAPQHGDDGEPNRNRGPVVTTASASADGGSLGRGRSAIGRSHGRARYSQPDTAANQPLAYRDEP